MTFRSFAPSALLLAVAACAAPHPAVYPPFPSRYSSLDGVLFADDMRAPEFELDSVVGPKGKELWFGARLPFDGTPLHPARLLDVLRFPSFGEDAVLILTDCRMEGTPDFEVIALAQRPRTEEATVIRRAWRADRRRERIVPIPTRGVTCWLAQPRYCAGADLGGTDSAAMAGRCAALFLRRNGFTQAMGGYPDHMALDSAEAKISLDTVRVIRHAMLDREPEEAWCRGSSCGAVFRSLERDDCATRLVTMDRDFAGLRLTREERTPPPGVPCRPRPPLATIPPTLPDSMGEVTVSGRHALFIFPVIPDTGGGWPDFATIASSYEWQAIVAAPDSAWIVRAQVYRPTPATPSASFRDLVRSTFVGVFQVLGGGRFQNEVEQAIARSEGIGGRAVVEVSDSTTVRRLFRARPALVRLVWCTPYGHCGDRQVAAKYEE